MNGYTFEDILEAYQKIGVVPGTVALVRGNLGNLYNFAKPGKNEVLQAHYDALWDLLGPQGTLVVPTNTLTLCNTNTSFNVDTTPSWQMGAFSEYVRAQPTAYRSRHPFVSYAAIGKHAEYIASNISRHAYGPHSVKDRMIHLKARCLSIGIPPNKTASTVHHAEHIMSVPYRYTKEFMHPIEASDFTVTKEPFYLHVCYLECNRQRNRNRKLFANFSKEHQVLEAPLGNGTVWGYDMACLLNSCLNSMHEDIYVCLDYPPKIRPYDR